VNHLGRDLDGAFARDEDDPSPVGALHGRQHQAGQADTTKHVDVKESPPVFVRDLLERLRFENPEVVDQDFDIGEAGDQRTRRRSVILG
jgi:hypothetical protein